MDACVTLFRPIAFYKLTLVIIKFILRLPLHTRKKEEERIAVEVEVALLQFASWSDCRGEGGRGANGKRSFQGGGGENFRPTFVFLTE